MQEQRFIRLSYYMIVAVVIFVGGLLLWDLSHGGVPSHHFLANKEYPAISNWWGGLLVPLFSFYLLYRVRKRLFLTNAFQPTTAWNRVVVRFLLALVFAIVLSAFFVAGVSDIPGYMMMGLLILALVSPIYRAECVLGFVIGMVYTFGGVLPLLISTVLAFLCWVIYVYVRKTGIYLATKARALFSSASS